MSKIYTFLGRDASRSFITGLFDEKNLIDDVLDLDSNDILGLDTWLSTYKKKYKEIGRYMHFIFHGLLFLFKVFILIN